jgi:hypothetical protein
MMTEKWTERITAANDWRRGYMDGINDSKMGQHLQPIELEIHSISYQEGYTYAITQQGLTERFENAQRDREALIDKIAKDL